MKTVKCSSCNEEVNVTAWRVLVAGPVKCSSCGVWINLYDGQPHFQKDERRNVTTASSEGVPLKPTGDFLSSLPGCFYAVAALVGIGLGITTIAVMSKGGNGELVCYMIGYTIGGVLSILATGRLIELVGRISDDVRAIRERTDSQK